MIAFDGVWLDVVVNGKRRSVLRDCSFAFEDPRMLVISPEPPLRAAIVGLVTGRFTPRAGRVRRSGRVSWAIGPTLPFRSNLTGAQTIAFVCDVYDASRAEAAAMAREMIDAPYDLSAPTSRWPAPAIVQLSYVLALLPAFDLYVIDGPVRLGYPSFYEKWSAAFAERVRHAPLIVSTAQTGLAPRVAGIGALLEGGGLRRVTDVRRHLTGSAAPEPESDEADEAADEDETDVL